MVEVVRGGDQVSVAAFVAVLVDVTLLVVVIAVLVVFVVRVLFAHELAVRLRAVVIALALPMAHGETPKTRRCGRSPWY